jgi:hypothetical protein
MAAPNLVNVATITGKTTGVAIGNTATTVVTNASSSGQLWKINSLIVSNVNGSAAATVTVSVLKGGATAYRLSYLISVPAGASLVVIDRTAQVYLEENDTLQATASASSYLEAVCSYEILA